MGGDDAKNRQWRHKSRAEATQNTGRGDTNHGKRRRKTRAVATQHTGSGDTKHGQWQRKKKQAEATQITGSGDAKHRQWRHKTRAPATQNTGSNAFQSAFRRWVKYYTPHSELHLADTHTGTTEINSVLFDVLTVVNILGLTPYSLVSSIPTNIPTQSSTPKMKSLCSSEALVLSHQTP